MNTLALISGEGLIQAVLMLIVCGVVFWLLLWLIDYCAIPEPFSKVARVILAVAAVILVINVLLSLVGRPFIVW